MQCNRISAVCVCRAFVCVSCRSCVQVCVFTCLCLVSRTTGKDALRLWNRWLRSKEPAQHCSSLELLLTVRLRADHSSPPTQQQHFNGWTKDIWKQANLWHNPPIEMSITKEFICDGALQSFSLTVVFIHYRTFCIICEKSILKFTCDFYGSFSCYDQSSLLTLPFSIS